MSKINIYSMYSRYPIQRDYIAVDKSTGNEYQIGYIDFAKGLIQLVSLDERGNCYSTCTRHIDNVEFKLINIDGDNKNEQIKANKS